VVAAANFLGFISLGSGKAAFLRNPSLRCSLEPHR
jgi:hypothetical protein